MPPFIVRLVVVAIHDLQHRLEDIKCFNGLLERFANCGIILHIRLAPVGTRTGLDFALLQFRFHCFLSKLYKSIVYLRAVHLKSIFPKCLQYDISSAASKSYPAECFVERFNIDSFFLHKQMIESTFSFHFITFSCF